MAIYVEEDVWKCPKHPSNRHRNGICPECLHDRLLMLCPDCANVRPCSCPAAASASACSAASSSSPFTFFSSDSCGDGGGIISNHIEKTPGILKSRSVGIPHLFSGVAGHKRSDDRTDNRSHFRSKIALFLWKLKLNCSKHEEPKKNHASNFQNNGDENIRVNCCSSPDHENFMRNKVKI